MLAQDLLAEVFTTRTASFLPLYFEAAGLRWTPLLSVYVHVLPVALFGKSVVVTRATPAMVSCSAAARCGADASSWFSRPRSWWAGALLMAIAPAWFLHSRHRVRDRDDVGRLRAVSCSAICSIGPVHRVISFAAILFGAATFYTYSNGQMIMARPALLLPLRHPLSPAQLADRAAGLGAGRRIGAAGPEPSVASHPEACPNICAPLTPTGSATRRWRPSGASRRPIPVRAQPRATGSSQTNTTSRRHRMRGYGNLPMWPSAVRPGRRGDGLEAFQSAPHRAVLPGTLATPVGAALVDISITLVWSPSSSRPVILAG